MSTTRILVVDDDADMRDLIAAEFEMRGCQVDSADCSADAIALLRRTEYEAVISDFLMPTVGNTGAQTGMELLAAIQESRISNPARGPRVVCLLTGFGDMLPPSVYDKGATVIFSKPISRRALALYVFDELRLSLPRRSLESAKS